jgi:hypothetical protein
MSHTLELRTIGPAEQLTAPALGHEIYTDVMSSESVRPAGSWSDALGRGLARARTGLLCICRRLEAQDD